MGAGASAQTPPQYKWDPDHKLRGPWTFLFKEKVQCACEGSKWCTRENPAKQKQPNAIPGVHSSWVGDRILAMARPWQSVVEQRNLVQEFVKNNIGMILNLQEVGEHAGCGPGNLPHTGFTYDPESFMRGNIGYYNFAWRDMGVPNLDRMMDIVQVMDYVTRVEHRKIAVHCHAGLGRTGLAIACYFVLSGTYPTPAAAIAAVRRYRAGAVQTSKQAAFVTIFGLYLDHLRCIFVPQLPLPSLATKSAPPTASSGKAERLGADSAPLLPKDGLVEAKEAGNSLVGVYRTGLTVTVPLLQQQAGPAPSEASSDALTQEDLGLNHPLPWNDSFHVEPRHAKDFKPRPPATYTEALSRQARLLHGPERRTFLRLHKFVKEGVFVIISAAQAFQGPGTDKNVLTLATIPEDGTAAAAAPGGAGAALPPTFAHALLHLLQHHSAAHVDSVGLGPMAAAPEYSALTGAKVDTATVISAVTALKAQLNAGEHAGMLGAPVLVAVMLLEAFFVNFGSGPEPSSLTPDCIKVIAKSYQDLFDSTPPSRPVTPSNPGAVPPSPTGSLPAAPNGTSLEYARQAYEVLEPLSPRDFELLLVFAAMIRTVAIVSGPGCEDALVEVVKWVSGLLIGHKLNSMATASEAMMAFLTYLAGRDEAYAMMVLLKRQRIVGLAKRTSPSGHVDVAAMLQTEAAALVAAKAPPPLMKSAVAAAPAGAAAITPLDPYVPSSPESLGSLAGLAPLYVPGQAGLVSSVEGSPTSDRGDAAANVAVGGPAAGSYLDVNSPHVLPALQLAQLVSQDIQQLYRVSFREEIAKLQSVVYPPPMSTGRIDVHDTWR